MDEEERKRARLWAAQCSPSPALSTSSVSQMAASLAQRVGTFVSGAMALSPGPGGSESMSMSTGHLTDAELEAEAERERDHSRREAERILTMEARERKLVKDRVLAMMENDARFDEWFTGWVAEGELVGCSQAKDLTPAQQVIQDVKKQDKERDKESRRVSKGKEKANEWPTNPNSKYSNLSLLNLNLNMNMPTTPLHRPYASSNSPGGSPNSPTPSCFTKDLYHWWTIAKRFEKLEKWTVGHVRALEERMGDVERWLVDKEREREEKEGKAKEGASVLSNGTGRKAEDKHEERATNGSLNSNADANEEIQSLRDEIMELQGRITELGRTRKRDGEDGRRSQ
ncbi:hypothetical protein VKT23_002752 [Stygiomarasmius scandens]|uniref:Uncharacterized protein n=1 Tax=Marasmiellus scandens TaxID=2682957 RepID=A0ABR1JZK3_9AGAR